MNWLDAVLVVLLAGWIILGLKGGIILGLVPLAEPCSLRTITGWSAWADQPVSIF
jgi:hypothetical protein